MDKPELASSDQRSKRKSFPSPKEAPWLVIPYGKGEKFQAFYNISEPDDTNCRKFIPELKGKSAYQRNSHQGWLIVLCDDDEIDYTPWNYGDCFLLNPLTMDTITLPYFLYWYTLDGYSFSDCLLSSPPKSTNDGGDGNSMVLMLFVRKGRKEGKEILVFCHPGDKEWRTHEFPEVNDRGELELMCYCKGKLYIACNGEHLEIDIQHGSDPKILSISKFDVGSSNIKHESIGGILDAQCSMYYVESSDEIFLIIKCFIMRGVYQDCVTDMEILKLDFSTMSWVEVTSLDGYVFFISENTRLCCSAKDLGFTRASVYFTQPHDMSLCNYDLEDKTVMLSLPCPDLPKPWFSPNWLMIPTNLRCDEERRRGTASMSGNYRDGSSHTKAIENASSAISPIRARTSINNDDEKEDIEEARPWDILCDDLVWFVASYLSPLEYIHLRAVCRNYRWQFPTVNWRKFCSTRNLQATVSSPWLVFAKDNESYSFINPMYNDENYLMSIPDLLKGSVIRFSKGGWLLMSKGNDKVFFYNPFTKAVIELPDLPDRYAFRGICFSSLPTSSDCAVFAISNYTRDSVFISFIKLGDEMWTYECQYDNVYLPPNRMKMDFEPSLNCPVFYNGAFYCLDVNGNLGVFTLEENGTRWEVLSMVPPPNCDFIYKSYLVELEGKLLSVLLGHYGKWVRIYRLDMLEMVWIEVEHLGRHTLFISITSCYATTAPTSQMENKIYFPRLQNGGILFYSLESGTYHSLKSEHYGTDYCNSKENLRCSWIEPNWSETT